MSHKNKNLNGLIILLIEKYMLVLSRSHTKIQFVILHLKKEKE